MSDDILSHFEFRHDTWMWCERTVNGRLEGLLLPASNPESENIPEGWDYLGDETGWAVRQNGSDEWGGIWLTRRDAENSIIRTFVSC